MNNLYSVHDILVGAFMNPFVCDSDARAIRDFGDICIKGDTPISNHPSDYTLERLGSFDPVSGIITPCAPIVLAHAYDFVKSDTKESK